MKFGYCTLIGVVLLSVCAARPESQENNVRDKNCDCTDLSAGCTDCPTPPDGPVCKELSDEALEKCNCIETTAGGVSNRFKRWLLFFNFPEKSKRCQCRIKSGEDVVFDYCPKDEEILGVGDEGYEAPMSVSRYGDEAFSGETFSEEALERDGFGCKPKMAFMLGCNKCWCNAKGTGAKYCTRMACKPKTHAM